MTPGPRTPPLDLLGVGAGPFNLSLAALADGVPGLRTAFHEQRAAFHWHPGLLIEGATLQVPFLADLVSLVEPTSPWSYLNYLKIRRRLFPFYFAEHFHIHRTEFDDYLRWVSTELPATRFGHRVDTVAWDPGQDAFAVEFTRLGPDGETLTTGLTHARNLALGVGTAPTSPNRCGSWSRTPPPRSCTPRTISPSGTGCWPPATSPSSARASPAPKSCWTCCGPGPRGRRG